jgi:hypothetical protein
MFEPQEENPKKKKNHASTLLVHGRYLYGHKSKAQAFLPLLFINGIRK